MKEYPSIETRIRNDIKAFLYPKYDGSCIRACWTPKRGFYKFGSRTQLISDTDKPLGEAISLLNNKYNECLSKAFTDKLPKIESVMCFFEFYGKNSCFGGHLDEPHELTLFDIAPYKKGLLPPNEYLDLVGNLDVCLPIYEGFIDEDIIKQIREGTLEGITFEGAVAKGKADNKTKMPIMFKIKTYAWLNKLKEFCGNNHALYKKLV